MRVKLNLYTPFDHLWYELHDQVDDPGWQYLPLFTRNCISHAEYSTYKLNTQTLVKL